MHKSHVAHLCAILAAGAISLPLLASTTSAFAASPKTTAPIGTQLARLDSPDRPQVLTVDLVTFASSNRQGTMSANWTVGFSTSTSGALATGDTITISAPATTSFPSEASAYKVNGATVIAIQPPVAGGVTIATPVALGNSTAVSVVITGVINPTAGTYVNISFGVSTSVDTAILHPASGLSFGSVVSGVSFSLSSLVGSGSATWVVGFTTSASGALAIGDTITIGAPATTAFPSAGSAYTVNGIKVTAIPTPAVGTVTFATPVTVDNSTAVSVQITGVTNPAAGIYPNTSFSVSTIADAAANPASGLVFSGVPVTTTISLGLSPATVAYGSETSEIFTVTVTGQPGNGYPEGTVAVYNSSTELCSNTLATVSNDSASATCSPSAFELAIGDYDDVFATYVPGVPSSSSSAYSYETSSSTPVQAFSVGSINTTTSLGLSSATVAYGSERSEVFTVTVTGLSGYGDPEGTVTVYDSSTELCSNTLLPVSTDSASATCSLTASELAGGYYSDVYATYSPGTTSSSDSTYTYETSSSTPVQIFKVSPAKATSTTVSESRTSVVYGHESATVFSVTVTTHYGEAVRNGQKVRVHVGPVACTAVLKGGSGTCRIASAALPVGSYSVSASYGGDTDLSGSSGWSASRLTVSKDTTRTKVSESPRSVAYGHESASVFSVTVTTRYGEAVPNGQKVRVHIGPVTCTAVLKGGSGACRIANAALPAGSYSVSARYGGDTDLSGSSGSDATRLTVG